MNSNFLGKSMRAALATAVVGAMFLGTASAAMDEGQSVSEAELATRLGPATSVVLIESTALRQQPRSDVRPGVAVPSGVQARSYQRVYNRDGYWNFIRVDDALGWVPSSALN